GDDAGKRGAAGRAAGPAGPHRGEEGAAERGPDAVQPSRAREGVDHEVRAAAAGHGAAGLLLERVEHAAALRHGPAELGVVDDLVGDPYERVDVADVLPLHGRQQPARPPEGGRVRPDDNGGAAAGDGVVVRPAGPYHAAPRVTARAHSSRRGASGRCATLCRACRVRSAARSSTWARAPHCSSSDRTWSASASSAVPAVRMGAICAHAGVVRATATSVVNLPSRRSETALLPVTASSPNIPSRSSRIW